jgi:hypothetical protein
MHGAIPYKRWESAAFIEARNPQYISASAGFNQEMDSLQRCRKKP